MEKNKPSFLSCAKRQQRWAIRKLSIGVCSVLLGVTLMVPSMHRKTEDWILQHIIRQPELIPMPTYVIALLFSIKLRMTAVYL